MPPPHLKACPNLETTCSFEPRRLRLQVMARDLNVDQIKKLWILDLIIQCSSLKKAALQAKVSPSAISQTLSALEESYGKPLLIRERGSVAPTLDAEAILSVVRPAFEVFEKLKSINNGSAPQISWLNFGTYESIAIDILPGLMQGLRQKLPKARLGLRTARTSQLLTMVRKGELCSALIAEVDDLDRFYVKEVYQDRLGLFISAKPPIAKMGWQAIETLGIGSLAPSKDGHPRYFSKFLKQLEPAKPILLCESFETIRSAAVAGSFVAVLPHRLAKRHDDLLEIHPSKPLKEKGLHKLLVVSQLSCDRKETDFIAAEAARLLNMKSYAL